jgi:hypothetical protein
LLENAAGFIARHQGGDQRGHRIAPYLGQRREQRDQNRAEVGSAAGILLRPPVKERGVGEAGAADRGAPAIAQQRGAIPDFAVERDGGGPRYRRVGRVMASEADAVAIEQANLRLFHDLGWQVRKIEAGDEAGDLGGECCHGFLLGFARLTLRGNAGARCRSP